MSNIRAFRTLAMGVESVVFSKSAGKARYATYKSANDAWGGIRFKDITVLRAYEHDTSVSMFGHAPVENFCYAVCDMYEPLTSLTADGD